MGATHSNDRLTRFTKRCDPPLLSVRQNPKPPVMEIWLMRCEISVRSDKSLLGCGIAVVERFYRSSRLNLLAFF